MKSSALLTLAICKRMRKKTLVKSEIAISSFLWRRFEEKQQQIYLVEAHFTTVWFW